MKQYLDACRTILDYGYHKENRNGGSVAVHGMMMKFNLQAGFPAVTTKKLNFKAVVAELLGFIRGADNAKTFRDLGTGIWDANAESNYWTSNPNYKGDGDLGLIYGPRWRRWRNWQPRRSFVSRFATTGKLELPSLPEKLNPDLSSNISGLVGTEMESTKGTVFTILNESRGTSGHLQFDIQFNATGYIKTAVTGAALRGGVRDPYCPSVCGIAASGVPKDPELAKLLKGTWRDMVHRCYGEGRDNNKWYESSSVCDRWLVFENFLDDFKLIPRWELKAANLPDVSLDKDFFDCGIYAPDTCRWSCQSEQTVNSVQVPSFIATSPDGSQHIGRGSAAFAAEHELSGSMVKQCVSGACKTHSGWEFKKVSDTFSYTEEDQLKICVAKLLLRIDDRRNIVMAWHPAELGQQALHCCHMTFQCHLRGEMLDLTMYQRSCDFMLGVPFNIASYALLNHILCRITGLQPGILTWMGGDCHIYSAHIDTAREQIEREPLSLPGVMINDRLKTLRDFENAVADDFTLIGYRHHRHIAYKFSV